MEATPRLALPLIMPSQAQKHVTHNDALAALDLVVQASVASRALAVPPADATNGDAYIVPHGTSSWGAPAGALAVFDGGAWLFRDPCAGFLVHVKDERSLVLYEDGIWRDLSDILARSLASLGINTEPDAVNRLAVASDAVLLSHAGSDMRLVINKAAEAGTASLVFQTGYSGRAEMGTTGSGDFKIKVSADGTEFHEALSVASDSGAVSFPGARRLDAFGAEITDLDEATRSGIYRAVSAANAPTSGPIICRVDAASPGQLIQHAAALEDAVAGTPRTWQRRRVNGAWQAWEETIGTRQELEAQFVTQRGNVLTRSLTPAPTRGRMADVFTSASFEINAETGMDDAYLTFHRPGVIAFALGLGLNGRLQIGGWSMGARTEDILTSGRNVLPQRALSALPPAAAAPFEIVAVTDGVDGATPAFSDGTTWRRLSDNAALSGL